MNTEANTLLLVGLEIAENRVKFYSNAFNKATIPSLKKHCKKALDISLAQYEAAKRAMEANK